MKLIRKIFSKWYINLLTILVPLTAGFIGYYNYYTAVDPGFSRSVFLSALYSAVRLFGVSFDAEAGNAVDTWVIVVLETARWLAVIPTGHAIIRLLEPFLLRFYVKIRAYCWSGKKQKLLLFGNNEENICICNSSGSISDCMIMADSYKECSELMWQGYRAAPRGRERPDNGSELADLIKNTLKDKTGRLTVIINTKNENDNLHLSKTAVDTVRECLEADVDNLEAAEQNSSGTEIISELEKQIVTKLGKIRVIVFGKTRNRSIYSDLVNRSFGILQYTNKYQLTALDFAEKYPFTRFMDSREFEQAFKNGCLVSGKEFNMIFVGFGSSSREIYTVSFVNNQFIMHSDDSAPKHKRVHYHIFEKEEVETDTLMNHMLFRYENDFIRAADNGCADRSEYFELPDLPADTLFHRINTNNRVFLQEFKDICTQYPDCINYCVVSLGDDLQNIETAKLIAAKKAEWGIGSLTIFARIKDPENEAIGNTGSDWDCISFGSENISMFNLDNMLNPDLERMAFQKHLMYEYEENRKSTAVRDEQNLQVHARFQWYMMDANKRLSNIYSVLSMRMKLQLIGLDYAKAPGTGDVISSNDEYFDCYACGDKPEILARDTAGKEIYSYSRLPLYRDFTKDIPRRNLAVQEHYRWNAFMISCGFVPAKKEIVLKGNVRDYRLREHGNLTTFEGLFDYRKETAQAWNKTEEETDAAGYDFQIMDDAWWLLNRSGFSIYRRYGSSGSIKEDIDMKQDRERRTL